MNKRKIITSILFLLLLVSVISGLLFIDHANQNKNITSINEEQPSQEKLQSIFKQTQTETGYTLTFSLANISQYSYKNSYIRVKNVGHSDIQTETQQNLTKTSFKTETNTYSGYKVLDKTNLTHFSEGTIVELYAINYSTGHYEKVTTHTITGNDMNYNVTITVSNITSIDTIDGVGVITANQTYTIKEDKTIQLHNITTEEAIIFGLWVDIDDEMVVDTQNIQNEIYSPTLFYTDKKKYTYYTRDSTKYKLNSVIITINTTEFKKQ